MSKNDVSFHRNYAWCCVGGEGNLEDSLVLSTQFKFKCATVQGF